MDFGLSVIGSCMFMLLVSWRRTYQRHCGFAILRPDSKCKLSIDCRSHIDLLSFARMWRKPGWKKFMRHDAFRVCCPVHVQLGQLVPRALPWYPLLDKRPVQLQTMYVGCVSLANRCLNAGFREVCEWICGQATGGHGSGKSFSWVCLLSTGLLGLRRSLS